MTNADFASDEPARPWWVAAFDRSYAQRYAHRDAAEAERAVAMLIERGAIHAGDEVLDLCCGAGRYTVALEARGVRCVGLDFSVDLLKAAAERNHSLRLTRGDMRALPYADASFDGVIQMFTAFGYFEQDGDNQRVLAEVARVLRPTGLYVLDLFNARPTLDNLVPEHERAQSDGSIVLEVRRHLAKQRRIEKTTTTRKAGHTTTTSESVRYFTPDELESWLRHVDFAVDARLGDYSGAEYDIARSPRMITIARKR